MAAMDDLDFSDVPDPVVDLSVSGILGDDEQDNEKYYTDGLSGGSSDNPNIQEDDGTVEEDEEVHEDVAYDDQSLSDVISDLYKICDREGVACTAPMEALVKSRFADETLYLSSLEWFVRGIIVANQTQVLPTIMTTISELKVENRTLQQSSNKINREAEKVTKLSADIVKELTTIKEDMKESFRESMKAFMREAMTGKDTPAARAVVPPPKTMADRIGKEVVTGHVQTVVQPTHELVPPQEPGPSTSKKENYIKEKKMMLKKVGFTNKWLEDLGDDVVDMVYDDELHATVRTMKITPDVKKMVVEAVNDQLEELLKD